MVLLNLKILYREQWKEQEGEEGRRRDGKTTSKNGQGWGSEIPLGQREIGEGGKVWLQCHTWAPSSEFVSSSIPSCQILTAHAKPFRGARDLVFCLKIPLDSLLVWASSGGSGETARMRSLAWTFAARIGDKYQIRLARPICRDPTTIKVKGLVKLGTAFVNAHADRCLCWSCMAKTGLPWHCSNLFLPQHLTKDGPSDSKKALLWLFWIH